jgi:hypothetical protein
MAKAHAYVRKNMRSVVDRQRQAYYKDRQTYQPTQPVWLWTPRLRLGQSRKFALYWTGPWQIKRQLNELMYEITPHHSWARQGSEAVSIDRLKPFHAMYVDALEHHCPPDPKADLKMLQFSTKKMRHMFHRCGLVRDQPAEGEDNKDWTPKPLTGNTGILGNLFLRHHWCVMLLPRKISADKDEKSTNDVGQSKKGSWSNTTKLRTDEIAPLHAKPKTRIGRTSWTTRGQPTSRR